MSETTWPEDPPGIDPETSDLPSAHDASERVADFLRWFGDGRVVIECEQVFDPPPPPLYARDLEVLTRLASPAAADDAGRA